MKAFRGACLEHPHESAAAGASLAPTTDPIIVAQMGKVASTSVSRALEALGAPVFQVHHLDRAFLDEVAARLKADGQDQDHIRQSYRVLSDVVEPKKPARIVSLVRDPIARNISAFFQNKDLLAKSVEDVDALIVKFLDTYSHDIPLQYFDLHIRPVFGVDVYETVFDHERKRLIAADGRYSVLVLRAEDPDEAKQAGLREFIARDDISLGRVNVGANKKYSGQYSEFLDRIRLPESYIDRMLSSKMARHFYTGDELEGFAKRWRKPASFRPVEVLAPETDLPTIAIVSPSYNQAEFVERMLESVKNQSYAPTEHIVQDACSTDGTTDILRTYADNAEGVDLRVEKDNGQVDAINRGFTRAQGDIVTWLNTDDVYSDPDALREVARVFADNPDVDVVYCRGRFVDPDGKAIRDAYINSDPEALEREFTHSVGILQPALFFRKSVFERFGPLDEGLNFAFDYEYWIRLARGGARFMFVDRTIVDATLHPNSKTQALRSKQYHESLVAVKRHYGFVPLRWLRRLAEFDVCGIDGIVRTKNDVPEADLPRIDDRIGELQREWNGSLEAYRALLNRPSLGAGSVPIAETIEDLRRRKIIDTDRLVATSFTSAYFTQGLNLIASLHRLGEDAVSLIAVYAIDLTPEQRERLAELDRVVVRDYPAETARFFDGYMSPKNYAYKCAAIKAAGELARQGDRVLWIDAGVVVAKPIEEVFEIISREGAFFVDHDDKPGWPLLNATFTHAEAARRMEATGSELLANHLCSCMLGYIRGGRAQELIDQAYVYSQDPEIVAWPKHLDEADSRPMANQSATKKAQYRALLEKNRLGKEIAGARVLDVTPYLGHRQDQSIYSILCARYGFKQFSATRYCWSDGPSSRASLENWKSGGEAELQRSDALPGSMPISAITYHHRGLYNNLSGLRLDNRKDTLVLLGNGPSLRDFDFARLAGADTLGMNAAYRYWDRINWYPTYYCCMDKVVIMSHDEEILRLIRERKTNGIRRFFLRKIFVDAHPEMRYNPAVVILENEKEAQPMLRLADITTGNFSALFGATLGYRRIALLGIDCNYVEQIKECRPAGATRLVIEDTPASNPNYFFDDYQQSGDVYNIPNVTPGFHAGSWVQTERMLTDAGVSVFNCNDQSKLTVFAFEELESVIAGKESAPPKEPPTPIGAEFSRDAKARIEELDFVQRAVGLSHIDDTMVDVGAHHGGSSVGFLKAGWRVLAFEPDPVNRERVTNRLGANPRFTLDPRAVSDAPKSGVTFFSSDQSTGASSLAAFTQNHHEAATVDVTTLGLALSEYGIEQVRLLKIDAEGFDKHVLEGFPWDRTQPAAIMCEFEDRKTKPLGYTTAEMADLLADKGYWVLVSEWHPIVRYGVRHDWRRLYRWRSGLTPAEQSWGNLIAFRYQADADAFVELVRESIVTGSLTQREYKEPPAGAPPASKPAKRHGPQSPAQRPSSAPTYKSAVAKPAPRQSQSMQWSVAPLPERPFVLAKLPWAPRRPAEQSSRERARLMLGKLGRVYWGRTGVLAGAAVLLWILGVILIASGLPVWVGLLVGSLAWGPIFVLIALIAINARRQAYENDATLREAVERGIREAVNHIRGK